MPGSSTLRKNDARWRIAGHGTRDILDMLTSPQGRALVLEVAPVLVEQWLKGSDLRRQEQPNRIATIRWDLKSAGDDQAAIKDLLNGSHADLAALDDSLLLGPLTIPDGYEPDSPIIDWVASAVPSALGSDIGFVPANLAADLATLRRNDREAWQLLAGGRLGDATRLGRAFTGFSTEQSDCIIRSQALLLYTIATRMRAALIRRWTTRPMGNAIRYEKDWQYQSRSMMTAIITPAQQFDAVVKIAIDQPPDERLSGSFLKSSAVIQMAEEVQRRVPRLTGRRSFPDAGRILTQHVDAVLRNLVTVSPDHLKQSGLGMLDFVEARIGVKASHAVVILATGLLDAHRQIDLCMTAARLGITLPDDPPPDFQRRERARPFRALARTAQWLRLTGRTDRNAFSIGTGKADDTAGHQMVRKALAVFAKHPPRQAVEVLQVKPNWWFS